jgi:hypothetical protein
MSLLIIVVSALGAELPEGAVCANSGEEMTATVEQVVEHNTGKYIANTMHLTTCRETRPGLGRTEYAGIGRDRDVRATVHDALYELTEDTKTGDKTISWRQTTFLNATSGDKIELLVACKCRM